MSTKPKNNKTSILRKKASTARTTASISRSNVSFASTPTYRSPKAFSTKSQYDSDDEGKRSKKHSKDKIVSLDMHQDEEDALDPSSSSQESTKIRDAKTVRALKRHVGEDMMDEEGHQSEGSQSRNFGSGDRFQGEEEVDKHFSLLHDEDRTGDDREGYGSSCPIEPFNLRSEREDGMGYFDGETYVFRSRNVDEEEDAWLDHLNEEQDSGGGGNGASRSGDDGTAFVLSSKKRKGDDDNMISEMGKDDNLTKEEAYRELISHLADEKETVMQALRRYGGILQREKKSQKRRQNHKPIIAEKLEKSECVTAAEKALHRVTELSNLCMMKFEDGGNIYDRNRHFFQSSIASLTQNTKQAESYFDDDSTQSSKRTKLEDSSSSAAIEMPTSSSSPVQWEYRGNQDNAIHGPYTTQQMVDWINAGYFVGAMAVDVRIVSNLENIKVKKEYVKNDKEAVDELLGDLEDSDDDEEKDVVGESINDRAETQNAQWMRSDMIDFTKYLQ